MYKILLSLIIVGGIIATTLTGAVAQQKFITIGTGGLTGVYYPAGGAICRFVNRARKEHGIRCSVEATAGSVYNINTLHSGELDMGIVQSDWQYHAYNGTGQKAFIEAGPFKELRSVFSLHSELVTIVARPDAGIKTIQDLVGKRVNIGNPGSGSEAMWHIMWKAMGHTNDDLKLVAQMKATETPSALCDNKIDAFFWMLGVPNGYAKEASTTCGAVMVEVSGPTFDKLVEKNSFFSYGIIPGGTYTGNPDDIPVIGDLATVVSSTATPSQTVYQLVKGVFENIDSLKKMHPAFAQLKESEMISSGLTAPLHEGAIKYYKERGWIE